MLAWVNFSGGRLFSDLLGSKEVDKSKHSFFSMVSGGGDDKKILMLSGIGS